MKYAHNTVTPVGDTGIVDVSPHDDVIGNSELTDSWKEELLAILETSRHMLINMSSGDVGSAELEVLYTLQRHASTSEPAKRMIQYALSGFTRDVYNVIHPDMTFFDVAKDLDAAIKMCEEEVVAS